ncbi:recombinase family protein [Haloarchaeobius sp. DYHT-AS-18]|uniref:recombinase family protein n=1 Tax=Haloarchaeobius sp. DYHT-AS-18 TaxID=3446117 RepID=UPI003EB78C7F
MFACYCRVSTVEQNLDRQLQSTHDYAQERLGAGLDEIETYRDKSTGTDTSREGYREMMADAEAGEVEAIVAHSISRISRSIRDLERTVDRLEEVGVELHIISESLVIRPGDDDPFQNALFRLLGVFAQLEAEMAQKRTREGIAARMQNEDYHHGPAPLGFEKDDGELVEAETYDQVTTVLDMVASGDLSKRKAAGELDCGRATISRAIKDRGELYGL